MALPMDEQRILDEIERLLAADDPRFAARLSSFGRPGVRDLVRTRRARTVVSAIAVALVAVVAVVCYAMSSIRIGGNPVGTGTAHHTGTTQTSKPTASVVVHAQMPVTGPHARP